MYELSLATWSSFGAVHAPCSRYRGDAACLSGTAPAWGCTLAQAQQQRLSSQHGARAWVRSLSRHGWPWYLALLVQAR